VYDSSVLVVTSFMYVCLPARIVCRSGRNEAGGSAALPGTPCCGGGRRCAVRPEGASEQPRVVRPIEKGKKNGDNGAQCAYVI